MRPAMFGRLGAVVEAVVEEKLKRLVAGRSAL